MKYVKDAYQRDLTAVSDSTPLVRVIHVMKRHRLNVIPVVDKKGNYIGSISEQDILSEAVPSYVKLMRSTSFMSEINRALRNLEGRIEVPCVEFVNRNYPTLTLNDTLSHAAEVMYREKKVMVPVIEDGQLAGLICRIDVLSFSLNSNLETEKL